jgi:hypothetical protein
MAKICVFFLIEKDVENPLKTVFLMEKDMENRLKTVFLMEKDVENPLKTPGFVREMIYKWIYKWKKGSSHSTSIFLCVSAAFLKTRISTKHFYLSSWGWDGVEWGGML